MAVKRGLEMDARVEKMIDEEFADFEKYLPCAQDAMMYRRKRAEYWNKVRARLKEEVIDGRADNAGND